MTSPSETIAKAMEGVTHPDAPEWIAVAQDGNGHNGGFWTCAAATSESPRYIRADIYASLTLQLEAMKREMAEKDERIAALEKAITSPFCVVFLDGRNEHGTHVLASFPASFNDENDDIASQSDAIMAAAEEHGFGECDHVWAEFTHVAPQIDDHGRVEFVGYWEFQGINKERSELVNRRARTLIQGEKQ